MFHPAKGVPWIAFSGSSGGLLLAPRLGHCDFDVQGRQGGIWVTYFPGKERQTQSSSKKSELAIPSLQCTGEAECLTPAQRDEST